MSEVPQHSDAFRVRRFMNWFPLGLTYATFYMGRYNINVVKGLIGTNYGLDKTQLGYIATAGFWTYAMSVIFNGPLADRFGGKKAILLGALGASAMNLIIGLLFMGGWNTHILLGLTLLYAPNSASRVGALSVVKVNAPWFHVRELGVFGGLFGIMISVGYLLALGVGNFIAGWGRTDPKAPAGPYWWCVFLVPAAAMLVMFVVDLFLVKESPGGSGHPD